MHFINLYKCFSCPFQISKNANMCKNINTNKKLKWVCRNYCKTPRLQNLESEKFLNIWSWVLTARKPKIIEHFPSDFKFSFPLYNILWSMKLPNSSWMRQRRTVLEYYLQNHILLKLKNHILEYLFGIRYLPAPNDYVVRQELFQNSPLEGWWDSSVPAGADRVWEHSKIARQDQLGIG